ncbi:YvcK family protein [Candidatus Microgenomates bacterium]|nr:YvcK family protein [Candidatus Microgenomates bacterium]
MYQPEHSAPEVAVVGGGTGSFTLLTELKHLTPQLSALVNMSDDGGSTGILRDELGVLPPGDVRQCLVALSTLPDVRDLFSYRFGEGSLKGHALGNIILSGLELQQGSLDKAIKLAARMLDIVGVVIPITLDKHTLVMTDGDEQIRGETNIGHRLIIDPGATLQTDPPTSINPEAAAAIERADMVVVAPGNLYGSLLPILAVGGVAEAIRQSRAKKVMVSNLVTKPGQTDGWHVVDYVRAVERYAGEGTIDAILYNQEPIPASLLSRYAADGEFPVACAPEQFAKTRARAIGARLVAKAVYQPDVNDQAVVRTLIRHDAVEVGRQLMRLYCE